MIMEIIITILQNQWTVAIGSAIISGVAVYFITGKLFKHGEQKEKKQNIDAANIEIISILTRCLVEGELLKINVVNSVRNSVCRRYELNKEDVFAYEEIGEELLNNILKTPFVSIKQKEEYAEKIEIYEKGITENSKLFNNNIEYEKEKNIDNKDMAEKRYKDVSIMMSLVCSMIPLVFVYVTLENFGLYMKNYEIIFCIYLMSISIFAVLLTIMYYRIRKTRKNLTRLNDKLYDIGKILEISAEKRA